MVVGNTFYKSYPYIRQEDIGTNTSNLFIDSLNISNLYLDGIGGSATILIASDINKNLSNCWKAKLIRACQSAAKPLIYRGTFNDYRKTFI